MWQVSQAADVYGPVTVFSPKADPGPLDMRITLLRTTAQPRKPPPKGQRPMEVSIYAAVPAGQGSLPGHRWFVTILPAAVLIEAYAPPEKLDQVKGLGEQMAADVARARKEGP